MRQKFRIIFLLMVIFCFGFELPPQHGPKNFDFETINLFKKGLKGGVITGFLGDSSMRGTIKQSTYWMLENDVFKGKYFIGNYYDDGKEFVFFCLLDYQQIEISFKNRKDIIHRIFMKKGEEIVVPVSIDVIPKGAHDILFVLINISETNNHTNVDDVQTHRSNVFVESINFPKIKFISFPEKKTKSKYTIFNIRSNNKQNSLEEISINMNNNSKESLNIAALFFENFRQIKDSNLFFKLARNKEASIPIKVRIVPGMMFCLKISNPYSRLELKPNVLASIETSVDLSNQIFTESLENR